MDHPFFSFGYLDDRTDGIEDFHNLALIDITDFDILQYSLDIFECCLAGFLGLCRDRTLSIVFEIHLDTVVLLDTLDRLSSLTDHLTHLLLWNEDREEKWCERGEFAPRRGETFLHLFHDIASSSYGFFEYFFDDLHRESGDLAVHLECGDPFRSTCDLEVHITEEVFLCLDIREDLISSALFIIDHPHRHSGNHCLDRYSGVHE